MNDNGKMPSTCFTPSGCLTADGLMLFVSGSLKGAELVEAQQHVTECPLCMDAAEGLRMWLKENNLQKSFNLPKSRSEGKGAAIGPAPESFEALPRSPSDAYEPNPFYARTALLNERIKQRMHARILREPKESKQLAYKPFVWLAAAATIIIFIGAGYVLWLQNKHDSKFQAQKQLKKKEAAFIAQIPETLAYPPSNSKVILNVKYNSKKGSHLPPVVTIVNEDVAMGSERVRPGRNNTGKTNDAAEYTESRQGVESDIYREESGVYKGQNSNRSLPARNSGGAMKKTESNEETSSVFISVQQMPSFPGGDAARKKYLIKNLRYPVRAAEDGIQGIIYVSFIVKTDGRITNVKLLHGIGGGCDEEAIRVVSKMPQWNPGYLNGKKVDVLFTMPVNFKLQ